MSKLVRFAAVLCAFCAEARMTARFTFDDIGRSGANMLTASVGHDITVKVNPANKASRSSLQAESDRPHA